MIAHKRFRWIALLLASVPIALAGQLPRDASSHRAGLVTRETVRLHYLEWEGSGPAVVLLPGYALTAHAFDEIGERLAGRSRVIAITPRGFGESDAPAAGSYTIATMVEDLRAVLDALDVGRAVLIGHSISGSTITRFAQTHPERVSKLIFLDAFPYFASLGADSIDALSPVTPHGYSGEMTYSGVRAFLTRYRFGGWSDALEADLRANELGPELERRRALAGGYVRDQRANPPDLGRIGVPSLQLCAAPTVRSEYPWLDPDSSEFAAAQNYVRDVFRPFAQRLCTHFTTIVPNGRTRAVTGSHYVFFTDPEPTVREIRRFLMN